MNEFEIEFDIKPNEFEIEMKGVVQEIYPELKDLEITPSKEEQNFSGTYGNIKVHPVETEELNIVPSTEDQSFNGLYGNVNVKGIEAEEITITPSTEEQVKEGLFNKVIVNPVTGGSGIGDEWEAIFKSSIDNSQEVNIEKIPDEITSIRDYAFYGCTNLALLQLPQNTKSIGKYAFYNCSKLAITEIPEEVTYIATSTFRNCISLKEIIFKGKVTSILGDCFNGCSNLYKVVLPNLSIIPTLGSNAFANTLIASGTGYIYVPDSLVDSFKTASNWKNYASQIKPISELT